MKSIYTYLVPIITLLALIGCSKDGENNSLEPSAQLDLEGEGTLGVYDTVTVSVMAKAPRGLVEAEVLLYIDGVELATLKEWGNDSLIGAIEEQISFVVEPAYAGKSLTMSLFIADLAGITSGDTVAISINESEIDIIEGKSLGSYGSFSLGSFYDVLRDSMYFEGNLSSTEMKRRVDLVYFHTTASGHTLAAPSNTTAQSSWEATIKGTPWPLASVENTTALYDLGTMDFDGIVTAVQIESLVPGATALDSLSGLSAGSVIGYQLSSSRGNNIGVLRINSTSGTKTNGQIFFDIKTPK